jgi:iron complex outermembrane receptor protein
VCAGSACNGISTEESRLSDIDGGRRALALASALTLAGFAAPALAQTAPEAAPPVAAPAAQAEPGFDPEDDTLVDELVVVAGRMTPRGSVIGDIPPEITLGAREIRSAGVSSVAELLEFLAPQTGSAQGRGGGRPVTLVNGARISSFAEIRDIPTEAIQRVEILPEEVALKYGYRADQRVVNFVLRPRFRAITTEAGVTAATAGGRETYDASGNLLRIQRDDRMQLDVKLSRSTPLYESERDLVAGAASRPFDVIGNVTASPFSSGLEIDPALSALAGQPLTVAAVPGALTGAPTLSQFAAAGGQRATDLGGYRTLLSASNKLSVNGVLTKPLGNGVSATFNGSLDVSESESRLGLASSSLTIPAGNPFSPFAGDIELQRYDGGLRALRRTSDVLNGHLGVAMNGAISGWRWSFTGNADRVDSQSTTETGLNISALQAAVTAGDPAVNPFAAPPSQLLLYRAPDLAKSVVTSADAEFVLNGTVTDLPAGGLSTTITGGLETRRLESESLRAGVRRTADLGRDTGRLRANFDLPIASRRSGVLEGVGDLSANFNVAAEHLSDFGSLTTVGFGANWSPIQPVRVIASFTQEDGAPSIQQLGDPEVVTPAVRVFDFLRGETVEVARIEGGAPGLAADNRRVVKLGVNFKPFDETNLTFRADYVRSRTRDVIASFPTATAEIEAAFPERFVRNAEGRLVQIDARPVNFARQDREEVRWGFNYSKPLGPVRPPGGFQRRGAGEGGPPAPPAGDGAPPQAAGGGRGPGGPGGFAGGPGGRGGFGGPGGPGGRGAGALQFALFHTMHITDEILIRDGVPVLDLLDGAAAGNGGGRSRHEIDGQAGISKNGYGARLSAKWQSGTEVRGGPLGGEDLSFSDLTTINLRLFADLGMQPIARRHPFLRGARATISVDNVFDSRLKVRTDAGETPVSYQPDYLDPLGRTIRVSFRKLFF